MKKIFSVILFCALSLICHSQNIDPAIQLKDGSVVDKSHVFLDGETPTFSLQNGTIDNVRWEFCLIGNKGEKLLAAESSIGESSFSFTITPDLFPRKSDLTRMEFPNDSSVYICAAVELYKGGALIDEMPLLLNVLPSRPKVTEGSLVGTFDYEIVGYDPLAHLSLSFKSDRMDHCTLWFFTTNWDGKKYVPEYPMWGVYMVDLKKNNDIFQLEYEYVDCDDFFTISAGNKYGSVLGDTIYTNDYITDPEILDFLEKLLHGVGIDNISSDECKIVAHNNLISVEGCNDDDIETAVYSLNGTLVLENKSSKKTDVNCLKKGAYLVKVKCKNKLLTKKIIKS